MKIGYLKKDSVERFTTKRSWRADAWRVVDARGNDMFQPWCNTRNEALDTAHQLKIHIRVLTVEVKGWNTYITLHDHHKIASESGLYYEVKREMNHCGYDCIKKQPNRDGHMTSAPFYIRARDKSWCILDEMHQMRDPSMIINKARVIVFRNHFAIPAQKEGHDRQHGLSQTEIGQH